MNQIIQEEKTKEVEAKVIESKEQVSTQNVINNNESNENKDEKKTKKVKKTNKKLKIIAIIILSILLLGLLVLSTIFSIINMKNTKILSGIKINNIDVSNLSKEKAIEALKNKMQENDKVSIVVDNKEYAILKENLNITYDFEDAVNKAYDEGRNSNIFVNNINIAKNMFNGKNIVMSVNVSENGAQGEANRINSEIPDGLEESSYSVNEKNITIKKGKAGKGISNETLKEKIKESIINNSNEKITIESVIHNPKPINLETIRNEIYKEPKDAYYEKNPFVVYPHVDGVDINIEEAEKILEEEKEEYTIPLVITKPKITTDQIGSEAFPNLLGKCTTKYDTGKITRTTNLQVAARTINGKVILPGETFSYNKTLGERTYEKGYRLAGGFSGGRNVDMLGGRNMSNFFRVI